MSLGFLAFALILARWGLVLGVCFVLYRRFSLPALPWLAGHYAISAVWSPFGRYIGKHVPDYVNSFQNVGGSTLMLIAGGTFLSAENLVHHRLTCSLRDCLFCFQPSPRNPVQIVVHCLICSQIHSMAWGSLDLSYAYSANICSPCLESSPCKHRPLTRRCRFDLSTRLKTFSFTQGPGPVIGELTAAGYEAVIGYQLSVVRERPRSRWARSLACSR